MRRFVTSLALVLTLAGYTAAQTPVTGNDTASIRRYPADPVYCSVGQFGSINIYYNTVSHVLKYCSATDTWTAVGSGGGSGTVTSIATTSPITGGTITTTGTIACATCTTNAAALTSAKLVNGAGSQATVATDVGYVTPTLTGPAGFALVSGDTTPMTQAFSADTITWSTTGQPILFLQAKTAGTSQFPTFQFLDSTGTAKTAITVQTNGDLFLDNASGTTHLRSAVGSTDIATFAASSTVIKAGTFSAGNGKFGVDTSGKVTTYNNTSTTGIGIPFAFGASDVTNQTASQSSVQLTASTPASGSYTIHYYADEKTPCTTVAAGGVLFTFSWTDGTLARTLTTATLSADTTGVGTDYIQGTVSLFSATASVISYTSTYNATCATGGPFAYDAHIWLTEDK